MDHQGQSPLKLSHTTRTYATKSELVYRALRKAIILGELKPGQKIGVDQVARNLNVSTNPAREAIKRLEAENLVTNVAHVGTSVAAFTPKEAEGCYLIRASLEGLAAGLATRSIDKKSMKQLHKLLSQMKKCVESNDYGKYSILNRKFHRVIYECSPYTRLHKMIYDLWDATERFKAVFRLAPRRLFESYNEHHAIVEAIAQRDSELAERLVRDQQLKVGRSYLKLLSNQEKK